MSASEFEGHEALIAELRAGTLDAPEHLHRRVLAFGPGKRARLPMSRRRKGFVLVLVAAGLAVGAAVIHGALNSGSSPKAAAEKALIFHRGSRGQSSTGSVVGATGPQGPTGARGATGLTGPTGAGGPAEAQGPTAATGTVRDALANSPTARTEKGLHGTAVYGSLQSDSVTIPKNRRVHAETSLQVAVANSRALTNATNKATQIVTQLGGYTQHSQIQASPTAGGTAYLELRVPVGKTEDAIKELGALGRVVSQSVSTQDLQQRFTKQTDTIGGLRRAIKVYEQALLSSSLTYSQRINLQIQLANAKHALTATRTSRSQTAAYAATADIQLTLATNRHAFIVHPGKRGRLGRLLHNAGDFLALEGIIILYALIVVAPFILLGALGWWLMRERRRREEKLLANA